jgi:predicted RNA-binding protein with PIN domain
MSGHGRLIVIDGYNLVHRTPSLRPGPDRSLHEARQKLLNLLSWTVGRGEATFLVVFDGADAGARGAGGGRVEVRWSRPPETADDVIRRIVEESMNRYERVTVVTADLEVARHARAMGADVSLSDLFITSVLGAAGAAETPGEKPTALTRRELEEWAEVFRRREDPTTTASSCASHARRTGGPVPGAARSHGLPFYSM